MCIRVCIPCVFARQLETQCIVCIWTSPPVYLTSRCCTHPHACVASRAVYSTSRVASQRLLTATRYRAPRADIRTLPSSNRCSMSRTWTCPSASPSATSSSLARSPSSSVIGRCIRRNHSSAGKGTRPRPPAAARRPAGSRVTPGRAPSSSACMLDSSSAVHHRRGRHGSAVYGGHGCGSACSVIEGTRGGVRCEGVAPRVVRGGSRLGARGRACGARVA